MKQILAGVYSLLIADDELKTLLEYDATTNKNILRFEGLKKYDLDRMLLFGKLRSDDDLGLNTAKVRLYYLELQALDKTKDIILSDIMERVLEVLNNIKIEETGEMQAPQIVWDGYISPTYYDNELNYYMKNIRFKMIVKKLD